MAFQSDIFFFVFMLAWFVGTLALGLRANAKGKAYLRRLPPVNGVPLDMYMYAEKDWLRGWRGPVWRAYRQQQTDPELEQLRQEARRRSRYVMLWMFGFPVLVAGVMTLLIVTGYVR
ncbi:MAG TPA: hypothetical protein VF510_20575 [Ktedonobacterales bacterium]